MNTRAFTLVDVMVAIVVLTVGVLGLAGTAALVTRMLARGQRAAAVAAFTQHVMEQQRLRACTARTDGSDDLYRGATRLARTAWTWAAAGAATYRLRLATTFVATAGGHRTEVTETTISCIM